MAWRIGVDIGGTFTDVALVERASTTAVCAYVGPLLAGYFEKLQRAVSGLGPPQLHVMGSSGGVFDIAEGLRMLAMAIESGPAAGVIAAALAGKELGLRNLISFDMGGTTAKASLIADGEIAMTAEYKVGGSGHVKRWLHGTGHPVRVPVIDLAAVSAGGGSIAWVDPGGALKVGPNSAGAVRCDSLERSSYRQAPRSRFACVLSAAGPERRRH